jgi:phage terminase large subunit-like protein
MTVFTQDRSSDGQALARIASVVLPDGRRWGSAATSWQWADAHAITDLSGPPYHFLTRPRGGSKTGDCAAIALGTMLTDAPDGAELFAYAADRDQARRLLNSFEGYVRRSPALERQVKITAYEARTLDRDVTLKIETSDAASSWGTLPYMVFVDELAAWPETRTSLELLDSIRSGPVKTDGRLVILTTAGDLLHFSYKLRCVAQTDPMWRLHEVPGPVPWLSPDRLAEQERNLAPEVFARLHKNEWTAAGNRLTTLADLTAAQRSWQKRPPERGLEYVIGLDVGTVNDLTAVAVCHAKPAANETEELAPTVVVDLVHAWKGSQQDPVIIDRVRDFIIQTGRDYNISELVFDPNQAIGLTQQLREAGIVTRQFNHHRVSNDQLVTNLQLLLRNGRLEIPTDPDLLDELSLLRLKDAGAGRMKIGHDRGDHDDRGVAIALAMNRILERAAKPGPRLRVLEAPVPARWGWSR